MGFLIANSKRVLFGTGPSQSDLLSSNKILNYEEPSTANTSTLSSNGTSFYASLNNSNNSNNIPNFSNNPSGSFFSNIKGAKQLNFEGVGINSYDNEPKASYLSNIAPTSNHNTQAGSFISNLLKNQKDSLTPEFKK